MALLISWFTAKPATLFFLFIVQAGDPNKIQIGFREALGQMGYIAWGVLLTLLLMSVYSIALILERWLTFRTTARQSTELVPGIAEKLKSSQLDEALKLTQRYRKSHLAMVINSGLQELAAASPQTQARQMRRAKRAVRRAASIKTAELQRGLASLATIGSTAPFVGLFGTVFGIIHAFEKMNEQQSPGIATVAGGIAEALYTTAFGLLVALPAVWMYNHFTSRVGGFAVEMKNSGDELIDFFLQQQQK